MRRNAEPDDPVAVWDALEQRLQACAVDEHSPHSPAIQKAAHLARLLQQSAADLQTP